MDGYRSYRRQYDEREGTGGFRGLKGRCGSSGPRIDNRAVPLLLALSGKNRHCRYSAAQGYRRTSELPKRTSDQIRQKKF